MPKTKTQNFIFTLMTTVLMAYSMIVYSVAINSPDGLVNKTFLIALKEFPLEGLIVFLLTYFVASPIAKKLAFRIVNPKVYYFLNSNIYSTNNGLFNECICLIRKKLNK